MEQRQFEQAITHMVHTEGVERLTPGDVARRLGIERKEAERLLDRMVTEGRLELDSDDDGNLFYFVPGVGAGGVFTVGSGLGSVPQTPMDDPSTDANPWGGATAPPPQSPPPANPWGNPYSSAPAPPPPSQHGAPPPQGWGYGQGQPPQQGWAPQPPPGWQGAPPPANPYGHAGPSWGPAAPPQPHWGPQGPPPPQSYNPYAMPQPHPAHAHAQHGMPPYAQGYYGHNALVPVAQEPKSPGTAAILSLFFPGAGQLYNGQIGKGLTFFFLTMMLFMPIYSIPLALVPYVWSVIDAYQTSRRINAYGLLPP